MPDNRGNLRPWIFAVVAISMLTPASAASAGFHVLHSFCRKNACSDGGEPAGGVILDDAGNLYGVLQNGGGVGLGAGFELTSASYARLHSFCAGNCRDGRAPAFPLIRDTAGNLYGTAAGGGRTGSGVAFELTPGNGHWTLSLLHTFCAGNPGTCGEGSSPSSGLTYEGAAAGALYDGRSPLYGTTAAGGALGGGTVFRLSLGNGKWGAKSLHDFCPPPSCAGGSDALGGLVLDSGGNIFGVANLGGASDEGAVFELSPAGAKYSYAVVYSFCSQAGCTDGIRPGAGLALDAFGNLYGTTERSGTHDAGTLFQLAPDGESFDFQVLHQFCDAANCTDGGAPAAPLALDAAGNIYGTTTQFGNAQGGGTLFELSQGNAGWSESVLYSFCARAGCTDGESPMSRVVLDGSGNLFGTTVAGGAENAGVVFMFAP